MNASPDHDRREEQYAVPRPSVVGRSVMVVPTAPRTGFAERVDLCQLRKNIRPVDNWLLAFLSGCGSRILTPRAADVS
jgi:hypothetical protein